MIVRRGRLSDAEPAVAAFEIVANEGQWIAVEPPVDVLGSLAQVRQWLASDNEPFWVLEEDGYVRGSLALRRTRAPGVASLGMLVVPQSRRRGGGRALLQEALAWARASDLHKVELEVFVENARAISLYASAGFQVEGVRREHYLRRDGTRRSTLIMALFV
jgi:[ribosomal protein S18]-alanine N-acetyltransferase